MTAQDSPFPVPGAAGHIVRGPTPGDGVGHALRRTFPQERVLPAEWQRFLDELDCNGRH